MYLKMGLGFERLNLLVKNFFLDLHLFDLLTSYTDFLLPVI